MTSATTTASPGYGSTTDTAQRKPRSVLRFAGSCWFQPRTTTPSGVVGVRSGRIGPTHIPSPDDHFRSKR